MIVTEKPQQLSLFPVEQPDYSRPEQAVLPQAVQRALDAGAAPAVSVSGGKDAMLRHLVALHSSHQWKGEAVRHLAIGSEAV
ncbi:hypothetical protein [cf. Phormidesmis sp. LEGE 11477]|uniref:hypothetical protein n=1 Tax=cf. Phormidesmis sp. LEGE 11477 TaxID=1828680 RepID=UPI001880692D|nr:hypothetical protein [cf. Phormidesmis sp. LEGE 11477]MBE9064061.1 hypothetical protein [cf. Phormidesmis sp. LEGE 11477]